MWGLESQTAPDSLRRAPNPEPSGPAVAEGQVYDVAQPFLLFQATDNLNNLEPYKTEAQFSPQLPPPHSPEITTGNSSTAPCTPPCVCTREQHVGTRTYVPHHSLPSQQKWGSSYTECLQLAFMLLFKLLIEGSRPKGTQGYLVGSTGVCPQPPASSPWHQRPPAGLPPSLPGLQRLQCQCGGAEAPRPTCVYSCSSEHLCSALMGHIVDLTPLGHSKVCPAVTVTTALTR